jgi:guanylate cyclase soluble subunit beta
VASNTDLTCIQNNNNNNNETASKQADHIQFLITEVGPKIPKSPKTTNETVNNADENEKETLDDFQLVSEDPLISPQIFCQVFPFHLMFNRQMKIVQAGKSVLRVIPKLADEHCNLLDILEPIRPHIQLSFRTILAHISTIYVLKTRPGMMLESDMFMRLKVSDMSFVYVTRPFHLQYLLNQFS